MTAYFSTVWNGWVTDYRMRTLNTSKGVRQCVLGCGRGSDQLEHYATCSVFWEFATKPCPRGLSLHLSSRSRNTFLLVNADQSVEDRVKMGLGIYAIHRTVQLLRHSNGGVQCDPQQLLRLWTRRASDGTRSRSLLYYDTGNATGTTG